MPAKSLSRKVAVVGVGVGHTVYGKLPDNVVLVRLDCGAKLFSNLVGVANHEFRIGMPVEAHFEAVTPEVTLVKFRPAGN